MSYRSVVWKTNCSPSNRTKCIVELRDGTYTIAQQTFGEWEDCLQHIGYELEDVARWRFLDVVDVAQLRELLASVAMEGGV